MPEIIYMFSIDRPPARVFEALTEPKHIGNWWTPDTTSDQKVGGYARFEFRGLDGDLHGYSHMRIEKMVPDKLVEWKVVDQNYQGVNDWIGTTIRFRLTDNGRGGTNVDFAHTEWKDKQGSFDRCNDGWAHVLETSLKGYLETGRGQPYQVHLQKQASLRTGT
jgi:uncharacterized protein YndB with AHSA1/START domain